MATILIMCFCLAFIKAQDRIQPVLGSVLLVKDECGEFTSASESQLYDWREGKIVKIIDGNTIVFESTIENGSEKKDRFIVDLAGVKASKITRKFLKENFLNKEVSVKGNTLRENDKNYSAIVYGKTGNILEVNCFMIRKGIARSKKFKGKNLVPDSKPYYYLKAEEKAKDEKLGIWEK